MAPVTAGPGGSLSLAHTDSRRAYLELRTSQTGQHRVSHRAPSTTRPSGSQSLMRRPCLRLPAPSLEDPGLLSLEHSATKLVPPGSTMLGSASSEGVVDTPGGHREDVETQDDPLLLLRAGAPTGRRLLRQGLPPLLLRQDGHRRRTSFRAGPYVGIMNLVSVGSTIVRRDCLQDGHA